MSVAFPIEYGQQLPIAKSVSFTLNFSKSAVQVIGSYYQMLRLGKNGFKAIMTNLTATADFLSQSVEAIDDGKRFNIISKTSGAGLPLVAWQLKEGAAKWDEFALVRVLRQRGWIIPAYTMAPQCVHCYYKVHQSHDFPAAATE